MTVNLLTYPRFILLFLRIKLLNLTSRCPTLPGGVLDEQIALMRQAQLVLGEMPLDQLISSEKN
jgi:hypothetical protein